MVHRSVVGGCGNTNFDGISMHRFPKDPKIRDKWERFVKATRKHWNHASECSVICGQHFITQDDFEGYNIYAVEGWVKETTRF